MSLWLAPEFSFLCFTPIVKNCCVTSCSEQWRVSRPTSIIVLHHTWNCLRTLATGNFHLWTNQDNVWHCRPQQYDSSVLTPRPLQRRDQKLSNLPLAGYSIDWKTSHLLHHQIPHLMMIRRGVSLLQLLSLFWKNFVCLKKLAIAVYYFHYFRFRECFVIVL